MKVSADNALFRPLRSHQCSWLNEAPRQCKTVYQAKFFPPKQYIYQVGLVPQWVYTKVPLYTDFAAPTEGCMFLVAIDTF